MLNQVSSISKKNTSKKSVAIALSGGVDSALSAAILKDQGYEVTAVHLKLSTPACLPKARPNQTQAVTEIAHRLNIPLKFLDLREAFNRQVISYYVDQYQAGQSPNPCIVCNQTIKFGQLYDWVKDQGYAFLATGHYASTREGQLLTAKDKRKDQTYFLYHLTQEKLSHLKFPLGDLTKKEVKQAAAKRGLLSVISPESQGLCFTNQSNSKQLLKQALGTKPGPVIDTQGNVIGQHRGLWFYTIGQRHGFQLKPKFKNQKIGQRVIDHTQRPPLYVINKIPTQNQLVVGEKKDTFSFYFKIKKLHLINHQKDLPTKLLVRIRHGGELHPTKTKILETGEVEVNLQKPVQGLAAGQSAVFYQKQDQRFLCLGGGVINRSAKN